MSAKRPGWVATVLGALGIVLSGCGASSSASSQQNGQTTTKHYVSWQVGSPKTLVACLDVSASVPQSLVSDSERFLANQMVAATRVGGGPITVYVRTISDNSLNPANNLLSIRIPAVPRAVKAKLS